MTDHDRQHLLNEMRHLISGPQPSLEAAERLLHTWRDDDTWTHTSASAAIVAPPEAWQLWQDGILIAQGTDTEAFELARKLNGPCTIVSPRGCRWDLHQPDLVAAGHLDLGQEATS